MDPNRISPTLPRNCASEARSASFGPRANSKGKQQEHSAQPCRLTFHGFWASFPRKTPVSTCEIHLPHPPHRPIACCGEVKSLLAAGQEVGVWHRQEPSRAAEPRKKLQGLVTQWASSSLVAFLWKEVRFTKQPTEGLLIFVCCFPMARRRELIVVRAAT